MSSEIAFGWMTQDPNDESTLVHATAWWRQVQAIAGTGVHQDLRLHMASLG